MKFKYLYFLLAILILAALTIIACGGDQANANQAGEPAEQVSQQESNTADSDESGSYHVTGVFHIIFDSSDETLETQTETIEIQFIAKEKGSSPELAINAARVSGFTQAAYMVGDTQFVFKQNAETQLYAESTLAEIEGIYLDDSKVDELPDGYFEATVYLKGSLPVEIKSGLDIITIEQAADIPKTAEDYMQEAYTILKKQAIAQAYEQAGLTDEEVTGKIYIAEFNIEDTEASE